MALFRLHLCRAALSAAVLAVMLAACGGGGGGTDPTATAVVSSSVGTPKFSQDLLITLQGRNLDQGLAVTSAGLCRTLSLSTTAPNVSSATTAYFICGQPAVGAQQVTFLRTRDSVTLATLAFTVPQPQVTLTVSNGAGVSGDIVLTLRADLVAATATNFLNYVNSGFYNGTVFHRLVPGFILQGGGYDGPLVANGTLPALKTGLSSPIALQDGAGLSNLQWTIAMARTNVADSATSQFFFNLVDNTFLDATASARGYAVFGSITTGTDVAAAAAAAPCSAWPDFFGSGDSTACLLSPNLTITAATQTR